MSAQKGLQGSETETRKERKRTVFTRRGVFLHTYVFLHILPPDNCLLVPFLKLSCDLEHSYFRFLHLTDIDWWRITFTIAATNCGKSCHNDIAASATAATPAARYTGEHWPNSHSVIATAAAAACSRSTASCGLVYSYYQPTALSADAATGIRYLPRCRCDLVSCHYFFYFLMAWMTKQLYLSLVSILIKFIQMPPITPSPVQKRKAWNVLLTKRIFTPN